MLILSFNLVLNVTWGGVVLGLKVTYSKLGVEVVYSFLHQSCGP